MSVGGAYLAVALAAVVAFTILSMTLGKSREERLLKVSVGS